MSIVEIELLAVALFFFFSDPGGVILPLLALLSDGPSSALFIYAFPSLDGAAPRVVWSL